jgi:hypothetical protein
VPFAAAQAPFVAGLARRRHLPGARHAHSVDGRRLAAPGPAALDRQGDLPERPCHRRRGTAGRRRGFCSYSPRWSSWARPVERTLYSKWLRLGARHASR